MEPTRRVPSPLLVCLTASAYSSTTRATRSTFFSTVSAGLASGELSEKPLARFLYYSFFYQLTVEASWQAARHLLRRLVQCTHGYFLSPQTDWLNTTSTYLRVDTILRVYYTTISTCRYTTSTLFTCTAMIKKWLVNWGRLGRNIVPELIFGLERRSDIYK